MKNFDWDYPVTKKDWFTLCMWVFSIIMLMWTIGTGITYSEEIRTWMAAINGKIRAKLS